jgi:hypothetical protein
MPITIIEGQLRFSFPDNTQACKYDEWSFYRNRCTNAFGGAKAVDILHIDAQQTAWLIEIKDYRANLRTKPSDLGDEIASKVRDTLACLVAARFNAYEADEKKFARNVLKVRRIKVVLHLEQPQNPSKLFPVSIKATDVKDRLKQLLKAVDAHPEVVDHDCLKNTMNWQVGVNHGA